MDGFGIADGRDVAVDGFGIAEVRAGSAVDWRGSLRVATARRMVIAAAAAAAAAGCMLALLTVLPPASAFGAEGEACPNAGGACRLSRRCCPTVARMRGCRLPARRRSWKAWNNT